MLPERSGPCAPAIPRETLLQLVLLRRAGGNPRLLREVVARCGSVAAALSAPGEWSADVRAALEPLCVDDDGLRAQVPAEMRFLATADASVITPADADWPPLLSETAAPPALLFCRGRRAALSRPQLAIVGSRHASPAGLATARAFATELAGAGFVIASGLALGIDAVAHEGALDAGGTTVAVLGCGLDTIYPRRHQALAGRVVTQGCLLGELLPGTPPLAAHFPQRNRIISGLALGVLVVEAAPDSGSLITARLAAEQGREVFAVPGSIHSPLSRGCHQLIREGATLVENSAQILEALAHFAAPVVCAADVVRTATLTPEDARLVGLIPAAGARLDDIARAAGMSAAATGARLNALLLCGAVHALPGGLWQPQHPAA